jgi:hypothetical protein
MRRSASSECGDDQGKDGKIVTTHEVDGKRVMIICEKRMNRIVVNARRRAVDAEHMGLRAALEAEKVASRMPDIERNAYRSALEGVRNARAGMVANKGLTGEARASALKAMDEAIAELEANLAKVN